MKNIRNIFTFLASAILLMTCSELNIGSVDYKDASVPVEKRVEALLSQMSIEEKLAQLNQLNLTDLLTDGELDVNKLKEFIGIHGYGSVQGINLSGMQAAKLYNEVQRYCIEKTRLGIPIFITTESLHGSVQDNSTIFPQSIAIGATFDPDLSYRMTQAISKELIAEGVNQTLCPVVDVTRDARWGRTEETFGEDPFLNGCMGIAEVRGYLENGINPVLKHYGPGAEPEGGLNLASVSCSQRDLLDIHLKPFEMIVRETEIRSLMSSYDSWNRIPNSASHYLLTELLREEWGFDGYVYSDWGAVSMLHYFQHVASSEKEAAKMALTAGLDFEASSGCYKKLGQMIEDGVIEEKFVNLAVRRILKVKFELGLFDNPYRNEGYPDVIHGHEHQILARQIADESIVLLKNEGGRLPLSVDNIHSIAVIGPNADQVQFGDYSWSRSNEDGITPLEGLRRLLGDQFSLNYAKGCNLTTNDKSGFQEALQACRKSDITVLFLGTASASLARDYSNVTSGEGFDQNALELTGVQEELMKALFSTGKPVILVLVTGKPICVPWANEHLPAIVAQWYGGEKAGDAIAAMLFGETNPCGKTPISWAHSTGNLPCFYNYLPTDRGFYHQPGTLNNPGRDYVFSTPKPLWSFGHGLSYTTFEYGEALLSTNELNDQDTLTITIPITNTGVLNGKEVVQLYIHKEASQLVTPVMQLKGFCKVSVPAGQTRTATIHLPIKYLTVTGKDMKQTVEPGNYELLIGSSSTDIRVHSYITVGNAHIVVEKKEVELVRVTPDGDTIR